MVEVESYQQRGKKLSTKSFGQGRGQTGQAREGELEEDSIFQNTSLDYTQRILTPS